MLLLTGPDDTDSSHSNWALIALPRPSFSDLEDDPAADTQEGEGITAEEQSDALGDDASSAQSPPADSRAWSDLQDDLENGAIPTAEDSDSEGIDSRLPDAFAQAGHSEEPPPPFQESAAEDVDQPPPSREGKPGTNAVPHHGSQPESESATSTEPSAEPQKPEQRSSQSEPSATVASTGGALTSQNSIRVVCKFCSCAAVSPIVTICGHVFCQRQVVTVNMNDTISSNIDAQVYHE